MNRRRWRLSPEARPQAAAVRRKTTALTALLVLAGLAAGCGGGRRGEPVEADQEIRALVRQYDRAIGRKDRAWLRDFMTAEFVYLTSGGAVRDRERFLDFLTSEAYRPEYRARDELEVHRAGGTAVVESRWRGRGTYDGRPFDDDQRCSLVFARLGDRWRLAAEHCTAIGG